MADIVILKKNSPITINTKEGKTIKNLYLGMGWKVSQRGSESYDLDLTAALCNAQGKIVSDKDLVYYDKDHLQYKPNGSDVVIQHSADNLEGSTGANDDEWMTIKLDQVPQTIQKIFIFVNMYDAAVRKQHFGDVQTAYIRLVDGDTNTEFAKYELEKEFTNRTGVMVAQLQRVGALWEVKILAQGVDGSIAEILSSYGLE